MKKIYKKVSGWIKSKIKAITPGSNATRGAGLGLLVITAILWVPYGIIMTVNSKDPWILLLVVGFSLLAILLGYGVLWVIGLLYKIPRFYKWALAIVFPLMFMMSFNELVPVGMVIISSLCGAAVYVFRKTGFNNLTTPKKIVSILGAAIGLAGFVGVFIAYIPSGFDVEPMTNAAWETVDSIEAIDSDSPAEKGSFKVLTMTYGSGKDKHRNEFGDEVTVKTDSVNGVAFLDDWKGIGGWWREKYWGFDDKSLPINGRVWYPEGDGPFPLALVVHGNHGMQDFSDPGYDYLGELLASRGIILASVDENFINGSWSDIFGGLKKENDARGWLLLEHLKVWHEWNSAEGHMFQNKIDTTNLALIGHSRGGEAVAHAAMLNQLPFYPDDASIELGYNYNIKSIVAIAPVDGQYEPGESRTKFKNVDYFVIHGAQDADVSSFMGSQQYERISFDDSTYHFKSGLYVYGANHGQFNTSWGNNDTGNPYVGLLNLKQLMSAEDQQKIAQVYISSFLDITLKNKTEYLPLFVDARKAKKWLPKTVYLNQFEDSNLKPVANFDEDLDVSTTTVPGEVSSNNLSVWKEKEIKLKWQKKGSRAAFIGWHYKLEDEKDSIELVADSLIASYTIDISSSSFQADSTSALVFSMAESTESSNPKTKGKWVTNDNDKNKDDDDDEEETENSNQNSKEDEDEEKKDKKDDDEPKKPLDFSIHVTDSSGQTVSFPLSKFSALQREIKVMIQKAGFIKDDKQSEKVFQTFYFLVEDFITINPEFDPASISKISFVFDKNMSGVIVVDNIGFMNGLGNFGN